MNRTCAAFWTLSARNSGCRCRAACLYRALFSINGRHRRASSGRPKQPGTADGRDRWEQILRLEPQATSHGYFAPFSPPPARRHKYRRLRASIPGRQLLAGPEARGAVVARRRRLALVTARRAVAWGLSGRRQKPGRLPEPQSPHRPTSETKKGPQPSAAVPAPVQGRLAAGARAGAPRQFAPESICDWGRGPRSG